MRIFNEADQPLGGLSVVPTVCVMVLLGKVRVNLAVTPAGLGFSTMFGGRDVLWIVLAYGTASRLAFVGEGD